jgi:hypothetical protein
MAQPAAQFVSPNLTRTAAAAARLTLAVGEGGLSYAVTTSEGQVLAAVRYVNADADLKPYEFLDKVMFDDQLLKGGFGQIDVVSHAVRWTLVPDNLAAKAELTAQLQVHHDVSPTADRVLSDLARPGDIAVVYALTNMLVKRCDYYYKKYSLQHAATRLIGQSARLHAALGRPHSAHLALHEGRCYLFVSGAKGLLLANAYRTAAAEDVLYYTLTALQTLGLDPATTAVTLTGASALRPLAEALLEAHLPAYVPAREHFAAQADLAKAGWALDQLPHLALAEAKAA